jgi:sporadic carbohydrate cluster 2OG-Fe(II) oxygenase
MQRRVNLSIQLPGDESSLLPVHTDTWAGDSPFEVVMWLPLVDCFATKSMFLMPPGKDAEIQARLSSFRSAGELDAAVKPYARYLEVPYGSVLVFSQNLMHGNRVNEESVTRWTMNCRFKTVLSPYADKMLGEFFEPINLRPATRMGMRYSLPGGFR